MNVPDGWILAVGGAVAAAFAAVWGLLMKYWGGREKEIETLKAEQKEIRDENKQLFGRVITLEAEYPARLDAIRSTGDRIIKETATEVVARLQKEKIGDGL